MLLGTYIFKPNSHEIAIKVINHYTDKFLNWDEFGVWCEWVMQSDGFTRLEILTESGCLDEYSESCYLDETVTPDDLTKHMMVVLDQGGFFHAPWLTVDTAEGDERAKYAGTDNPKYYSLEDTELSEIICALQENGSRSLSFNGHVVTALDKDDEGRVDFGTVPLAEYAMTAPLK